MAYSTGAYCYHQPGTCIVFCSTVPQGGSWVWVHGPQPGMQYPIQQFVTMFPNSGFYVPSYCGGGQSSPPPGPSQPPPAAPSPPATPPPPPPPPPPAASAPPVETYPPPPESGHDTAPPSENPCAPAMAQRADSEDRFGFTTAEHLKMTGGGQFFGGRVGAAHYGAAAEPPRTGAPLYTRLPRVRVTGDPRTGPVTVWEPGTGPGWTAFASPDLNEFALRGDGVHPEGLWPRKISAQTFLIHSGARVDAAAGDNADQQLGIGLPSARTINPRSGWYMRRDSSNVLTWTPTDAHGVNSTTKLERFQLNGILYTASGRRLNALRTSGDVTLTSANDVVFITGAHTVTLPPSPLAGDRFHIVNLTAANRTIDRNLNNIDGAAANLTLPAGASVILVQDKNGGTDWRIAGAYKYPTGGGGGEANTASNVGTGEGWFKQKTGVDLEFKTFVNSTGSDTVTTVSDLGDELSIDTTLVFPIVAPDDGVANYAFDAGTTPGSENAGMGFTPGDEGPSLFDIAGAMQLRVSTTGIYIPNKLTVDGLIDPTGLELTPVAANPGGTAANTLWLDSGAGNVLKHGANRVMLGSNNLSEVTNQATARSNIGAGTASITGLHSTGNVVSIAGSDTLQDAGFTAASVYRASGTDVAIADGGTGASTAQAALDNLTGARLNLTGVYSGAGGNDVAIGNVSKVRLTSGSTLTGMVPAGGGSAINGQVVIVENATGGAVTISHLATSSAANQIQLPAGEDMSLDRYSTAVFVYSTTDGFWRYIGQGASTGGGGISAGVSAGLNFWGAW